MDSRDPIVITGIGLVTPLGHSREKTWAGLLSGQTGIRSGRWGLEAPIMDFVLNGARSRAGDFALTASEEALRDAGLSEDDIQARVIGSAVSLSKPLVSEIRRPVCALPDNAADHFHVSLPRAEVQSHLEAELLISSFTGFSPETLIRNRFHLSGPTSNFVGACATGVVSLSAAAGWIRDGLCEGAFVGAAESSLVELYFSGFRNMGVIVEGENPSAVRPFDKDRSGFAMGEGSAVLFIEKKSSAEKRGRKPYARIENIVLAQSGSDSLRFDEGGREVFSLMKNLSPRRDGPLYINAHGTGTRLNDQQEIEGLNRYAENTSADFVVSSTKAATGHLLGAAGAVEAAFAALALRDGKIPPTLNLTTPDPAPSFRLPTVTDEIDIQTAASLSYGFGGQMGGVLLARGDA